jgi:hypothetical protein
VGKLEKKLGPSSSGQTIAVFINLAVRSANVSRSKMIEICKIMSRVGIVIQKEVDPIGHWIYFPPTAFR